MVACKDCSWSKCKKVNEKKWSGVCMHPDNSSKEYNTITDTEIVIYPKCKDVKADAKCDLFRIKYIINEVKDD